MAKTIRDSNSVRDTKTIRDPATYLVATLGETFGLMPRLLGRIGGSIEAPEVRAITVADLRAALRAGLDDLAAFRSDVIFVCLLYPAIGLVLAWFTFNQDLLPLFFPMLAGFTILGPICAVGLYEMSRRRDAGRDANWSNGLALLGSASVGPIALVGGLLLLIFIVWILVAWLIYAVTLGPEPPAGIFELVLQSLGTGTGWVMIIVGFAVGAVFAAAALCVSFVSLPLLVDRDVGFRAAIATSVAAARASPGPVALWGLFVALSLAVAAIPALLGLIVVFPLLGHATWHLYRRAVVD